VETIIRVVLIYAFVLLTLRAMGKREFGELSPLELVSLLLVPELVATAVVGEDYSVTNAFLAVGTLFTLVFLNSLITFSNRKIEQTVEGTPSVLAYDGRLIEKNMRKERVTPDELYGEIRKQGLERLDEVRWAVLEGDGKISIIPKSS